MTSDKTAQLFNNIVEKKVLDTQSLDSQGFTRSY